MSWSVARSYAEKWVESIENKVLKECARQCTSKNPKDRGTMSDVLSMLKASEPAAMYADAYELYTKEDYAGAVGILEDMVSGGNQDALFLLARCNSQGQGVQKNEVRAADLYGMAADKGHAEAQFRLAEFRQMGEVWTRIVNAPPSSTNSRRITATLRRSFSSESSTRMARAWNKTINEPHARKLYMSLVPCAI